MSFEGIDINDASALPASDNLSTPFDFALQRIVSKKDADGWYDREFVRRAAGEDQFSIISAIRKMDGALGKDFRVSQFKSLLKDAKQEIRLQAPKGPKQSLIVGSNGDPKPLLANAILKLKASGLDIAYDAFAARVIHRKPSPWGTSGLWADIDDLRATNYLHHASVSIKTSITHEAATFLAHENTFHPVRDWLNGLKWDGTARLPYLVSKYFGAEGNPYSRGISRCWAISAVARIIKPGCLAKYMVVLEGPQDLGKSNGLRALTNGHLDGDTGTQWFRDSMPKIDSRDIGQYMQGVWIIEVAEIAAFRGKEWESVKAFISQPSEYFRKPYGHNLEPYPRQCVFAATTNEDQWGGDPTGLVRFWPFKPGRIDLDAIMKDRDQLFAEAKALFDQGVPWWDNDLNVIAKQEQLQRHDMDIRTAEVLEYANEIAAGTEGWCSVEALLKRLGIAAGQHDKSWKFRIGAILRIDGWKRGAHRFGTRQSPEYGFFKELG